MNVAEDEEEIARKNLLATVEVGSVTEIFGDNATSDDLAYYVGFEITIDGTQYPLGVGVGIQESDQGQARASGAGEYYRGGPHAWWVDASDYFSIPDGLEEDIFGILQNAAGRLFREAEETLKSRRCGVPCAHANDVHDCEKCDPHIAFECSPSCQECQDQGLDACLCPQP